MRWSAEDIAIMAQQDRDDTLEELETSGNYRFWLEKIEGGQEEEEDTENLSDRLDELLRSFGGNPKAWKEAYIGSDPGYNRPTLSYEEFQRVRHERIGKFIAEAASLVLDVENEEEGSATASWFFWLGNEHILRIESEGWHWMARAYRHPSTGEVVYPDDSELYKLETEYNRELEYRGAEYGMENEFNAVIQKAPKGFGS